MKGTTCSKHLGSYKAFISTCSIWRLIISQVVRIIVNRPHNHSERTHLKQKISNNTSECLSWQLPCVLKMHFMQKCWQEYCTLDYVKWYLVLCGCFFVGQLSNNHRVMPSSNLCCDVIRHRGIATSLGLAYCRCLSLTLPVPLVFW